MIFILLSHLTTHHTFHFFRFKYQRPHHMGLSSVPRRGGGGGVGRYLPGFRRESKHERLDFTSCATDVELEFLDHCDMQLGQSASSDDFHPNEMQLDHEEDECHRANHDGGSSNEENRNFWDNQLQLLQTNLYRTSSMESRIRNATKEAVLDIHNSEIECSCSGHVAASSCRNCLMREVSRRLQLAGYNSAICKTKWKNSPNIPSGEHTFLDVIESSSKEKGDVRVIIELNFRAEFEMARASEDYNQLVRKLPEVYVGKVERLSNIIKILCMAAKKCMKDNKMHMGPWRKHKYMLAKWLGPCKRNTSTTSLSMGCSQGMPKRKPKASMLTVDLLEKLPNMHCTAVEVV